MVMCMSVMPTITGFKYFNFCHTHSALCLFLPCVSFSGQVELCISGTIVFCRFKFPANHECLLNHCGINFHAACLPC